MRELTDHGFSPFSFSSSSLQHSMCENCGQEDTLSCINDYATFRWKNNLDKQASIHILGHLLKDTKCWGCFKFAFPPGLCFEKRGKCYPNLLGDQTNFRVILVADEGPIFLNLSNGSMINLWNSFKFFVKSGLMPYAMFLVYAERSKN